MTQRAHVLPLGKKPHVHDPKDLLLARYVAELPPLPAGPLGHGRLVADDAWGVLGNADYGDCVWAGSDHETMLFNLEAGKTVTFTDQTALSDYTAVTGFNPNDPSTDQGTAMRDAMNYRRKTGVIDADGTRHKIRAYTAIAPGSLSQSKIALFLFGVAAIGIEFPTSAMDQFNQGKPWDVVSRTSIEGGHYVPVVYFDPVTGLFYCVTWGKLQPVTARFIAKYMDEGYAPMSTEVFKSSRGKSLEGFNRTALEADLKLVSKTAA